MPGRSRPPTLAALGLRAVLSAPVVAGDVALGAIKLYAQEPRSFTVRDETTLGLLAAQSALLLAGARSFDRAGRLGRDVQELLARRDALQQATGLVMARDGLTEQGALAHLAAVAERERVEVHQVVTRTLAAHARRVGARP